MSVLICLLHLFAAARAEAQEWSIDPSTGYFRAVLLKEGVLAGLGHDHVVEVRDARGTVSVAGSTGAVHLEVNAAGLEIDLAPGRAEEGFRREVSESDQSKIRANMRGPKGLDVKRHPFIAFDSTSVERVESMKGTWMVTGVFSLHGSTGALEFPVTLSERPEGLWAYGYVRVRPSDYGIKPFSVAGGLIKVADEAFVKFNLALKASGLPSR